MGSILDRDGGLRVADALRRGHEGARTELVRAAMEGRRIAKAAKRIARLCLPHFESEEQSRELAELAYNLRIHKGLEDEVTYPTVDLIGGYLQENLAS
jgi:hypothetical protein